MFKISTRFQINRVRSFGAPNNNLKLRSLKSYDQPISTATLGKFSNHSWSFMPELIVLPPFNDEVKISVKPKIVQSFDGKINLDEISKKF